MKKKLFNSDLEALESLRGGHEKGFTYFFEKLYPKLLWFGMRFLKDEDAAKDIVQHSFIRMWESGIYKEFNDVTGIAAWLYQVSRNKISQVVAHEKVRIRNNPAIAYETETVTNASVEDKLIRAEVIGDLYLYIDSLPSDCKTIFKLLFIRGKEVREVAEELGLAITTIKNQKYRGISIIKNMISENKDVKLPVVEISSPSIEVFEPVEISSVETKSIPKEPTRKYLDTTIQAAKNFETKLQYKNGYKYLTQKPLLGELELSKLIGCSRRKASNILYKFNQLRYKESFS